MARYHLSIKPRGDMLPCQSFSIGGRGGKSPVPALDFRHHTTIVGKGQNPVDQTYLGAVGEYTDDAVTLFREKVEHFVVVWGFDDRGNPRSAQIWDKRMPDYFDNGNSEPLSQYLVVSPIAVGVTPQQTGTISPEQVAALASAQASEQIARETDPTDARRRKAHGRAKANGESLEG